MWYTPYETKVWKKLSGYFLWVILILWLIVTFVFLYFYFFVTGSKENKKGGTFVEGIFNEVSYLPYLKSDDQSVFYQKLLFRSCLNPYVLDENGVYKQDLCKVYTEDDQNYILKIIDDSAVRSDGVNVSIEDVYFTYEEILHKNRWSLDSLNTWNSVTISLEDGKIKVTFPTISSDNINFFTNAILPKHVVDSLDLDSYINYFSTSPVTNGCSEIVSQTKDLNSLIFDLDRCDDTNFAFYQVKNYGSFEDFENFLRGKGKKAIVDAYSYSSSLEGFTGQNVLTSKLLGVFFNTDSGKANVRLRRSIGGLIYHNFFTGDYADFVKKYDGNILNYYVSAGENVSDLINRLSLSGDNNIDANDLKDSGAQELPGSMSINGVDRKFVFFLQKPDNSRDLEIKFSNEFSDIKIKSSSNGSTWSPKNYNPKNKKVTYKLVDGENLKVGVNNFTISGFIKNKTYTIASIDVYVFDKLSSTSSGDNQWKLSILYYDDPASQFAVQQMSNEFKHAGILDNFVFEPVYNAEELEGKLLMGTYDIYVGTIDLGSRRDILSLFGTEDPLLNPSRYRNPVLSSLINQYYKTRDGNVESQINILLAQDMPVIFIGNTYDRIQLQNKIKEEVFPVGEDGKEFEVSADKWRYDIYSKYSIVHSVRLDKDNSFSAEKFETYLVSSLFPNNEIDLNSIDIQNRFNGGSDGVGLRFPYFTFNNVLLLQK